MTLLGHADLIAAMTRAEFSERLLVVPLLDHAQIGPASLDLRLGTEFRLLRRTEEPGLDPGGAPERSGETVQDRVAVGIGKPLWLHPGQFALGATLEFLRLPPDLGAYVLGRSSWGRVGLLVATAILVQPGFKGALTLELINHGEAPIALYPGTRIAQLAVHSLEAPTATPYGPGGKYVGPTGPQASRLERERAEIEHVRRVGNRVGKGAA